MSAWLVISTLAGALTGAPRASEPASPGDASSVAVAPAPSEDHRVVLLPLEVEGPLADSWRGELGEALRQGLADGRLMVVDVPAGEGDACHEAACLAALSRRAEAEGVVRARVTVVDRDYDVLIELLDASGATVAISEEGCSVCGMAEVVALVRGQAAALRGRLMASALQEPVLELRSTPSGAEVWVDGTSIGVTPLRHPLPAGPHVIELSARGYSTEVRRVEAAAGVRETLDVVLLPSEAPRRRRRIAGWSLGGVGVAAVGSGAVLWGLDSRPAPGARCSGDNVDAEGRCRYLYDTQALGIAVTTVGVAVVATAVGLVVSGRRTRTSRAARRRHRVVGLVLR